MSLIFISSISTPNYIALSSDIVNSKIEGASNIGETVFITDASEWYIIKDDLTLEPFSLPIGLNGEITIGEVSQGNASLTESWKVNLSEKASFDQYITVDAGNSSTNNLAPGGYFLGSSLTTLSVVGIQVSLSTDQNCLVEVQQSTDNVNWDITDRYNYNKISNNFGITIQAVSSYVRVKVTNLSTTAYTTHFRLQTVLAPMVEALPRSLDEHGYLKNTIIGLRDHFGFEGQFTPAKDLKVAEPYKLVGTTLGAALDPTFINATNSGSDSVATVANSIAIVSSGSSNGGYGQLQSTVKARYVFSMPHVYRGVARFAQVAVSGNTRRFGMFTTSGSVTPVDGAYFEVDQDGILSVHTVSGTTSTLNVSSGNFNGEVSEYSMDTNSHLFEIIAFTRGVWFYIDSILIHRFQPTNVILYKTLTVNITATSVNSASGTTSGTLEIWNTSISRLGRDVTAPVSKFYNATTTGTQVKLGAGAIHSLMISNVTNNANVTFYDNTSASGSPIYSTGAMSNNLVPFSIDFKGLPFFSGLYMVISGAACNVTTVFE